MAQKALDSAIRELHKLIQGLSDKITSLDTTVSDQKAVITKQTEAINSLRVQLEGKQKQAPEPTTTASAQTPPTKQLPVRQARLIAAENIASSSSSSAAALAKRRQGAGTGKQRLSTDTALHKCEEVSNRLPNSKNAPTMTTVAVKNAITSVSTNTTDIAAASERMEAIDDDSSQWKTISRKRPAKPLQILTGSSNTYSELQTVEQLKYIQVWSFTPETTAENVLSHLTKIANCDDYLVEKRVIKTDKHAAFVVGFPQSMYEKLFTPDSWPQGVKISNWFRRSPRHSDRRGASNTSLTADGHSDNTSAARAAQHGSR